jgi:hypothetical protein
MNRENNNKKSKTNQSLRSSNEVIENLLLQFRATIKKFFLN